MNILASALIIAIQVHADQRDKQGEPYLFHVLRVMDAVSEKSKVAAVLHDVFEDGDMLNFPAIPGLDAGTGLAVILLTRVKGETYETYIKEIVDGTQTAGEIAKEVKLADLKDNLSRIPEKPFPYKGVLKNVSKRERDQWTKTWGSLKRRYEKAINELD